jgi:hypothetical protein
MTPNTTTDQNEREAIKLAEQLVHTCDAGQYCSIMVPAGVLRALLHRATRSHD